jgi:hypothetical protein
MTSPYCLSVCHVCVFTRACLPLITFEFRLLRWIQNFNQPAWTMKFFKLVDLQKMNNFIKNVFVKKYKKKIECGGQLKVKMHILFYGHM